RAQHPRGPRLVGVARVADARVVDDGAGTAHAVRGALAAAELAEAVGLGGEPAKEDPTLALSHRKTSASRVSSVKGITIRRFARGGCVWTTAPARMSARPSVT